MHQIDILLSTYNGEKYLREQLDSILKQTNTSWHLLVRDDTSSDQTKSIVDDYHTRYPDKITVLKSLDNLGVKQSFSTLLQYSTAPYIMFCDQDDIWLKNKIELTFRKMKESEVSTPHVSLLVHTDLKVVNVNLQTLSNSYWHYQHIDPKHDALNRLLVQNTITGCTVMINKKLTDIVLPVPNEAIMHDWWLGLIASAFGEVHYIKEPTILYRQHSNNDTGATSFNLTSIINKARNIPSIDKYINQAEAFLVRYKTKLSSEQIDLLEGFIATKKQDWLRSKITLFKYRIVKQSIIRNIGLFLNN